MNGDRLGLVVEGSLVDGLRARLDASVEDIRVGSFVKIEGEKQDFFCLITDVQLGATDPQMLQDPPDLTDDYLRQVLAGTTSSNPVLFLLAVFLMLAWKVAGYYGLDRYLLPIIGTPWESLRMTTTPATPAAPPAASAAD